MCTTAKPTMVKVLDSLTCVPGLFILLDVPMPFTKLNVKKWIKANKHMTIASVEDTTNPNHTGGALTEDN
jgi:hypothetical protein